MACVTPASQQLFNLLDLGVTFYKSDQEALKSFVSEQLTAYYKLHPESWEAYSHFSPLHYTRNLVNDNCQLEAIILCWEPGQVTRVHDHAGSHCWMLSLLGEVEETRFIPKGDEHLRESDDGLGVCPELEEADSTKIEEGKVAYMHDQFGLHSVGNHTDKRAITLHIYSPPIRKVKIFEPETKSSIIRIPGFFSVHGRPTGKN